MKEKLIEKFVNLLGVRSIVTIALVGALIYGFIVGKIPTEQFVPLVILAVQSLFVKKANEEQIDTQHNTTQRDNTTQEQEIGKWG